MIACTSSNYKSIVDVRVADYEALERIFKTIEWFITEKKLILFGGTAIDSLLRLRNCRIYGDHEWPDFDVYSPDNIGHAHELVQILVKRGHKKVEAKISMIHPLTMKVFVNYTNVLDLGYMPPAVFDNLPTIVFKGIHLIHPEYQRIDQHIALCFPLANPPKEDVFHRAKKDISRFNLLNQTYPMTCEVFAPVMRECSFQLKTLPLADSLIAIHGFLAFQMIENAYRILKDRTAKHVIKISKTHIKCSLPEDHPMLDLVCTDNQAVALENFPDMPQILWSSHVVIPSIIQCGQVNLHNMKNKLIAICKLKVAGAAYNVVHPQYLMMWLLSKMHLVGNQDSPAYLLWRSSYVRMLEIMQSADRIFDQLADSTDMGKLEQMIQMSPFCIPWQVMGTDNQSIAYQLLHEMDLQSIKQTPPDSLLRGLPRMIRVNEDGVVVRPEFDYTHPLYTIAGERMN